MVTGILAGLGLTWFIIGSVLTYGTLTELATGKPERQVLRRERMDCFHADAVADFFRSGLGILWVFTVVMVGWPYFLYRTLRCGGLTGR